MMPPRILSVDPESAPIAESNPIVIRPVVVLVPATLSSCPPKLMPPSNALPVSWSDIRLGTVTPPESCTAAPVTATLGATTIVPLPAPLALLRRTAPALTVMPPDQPEALLSAVISSTPLSFLKSAFAGTGTVNGALSVS